jgi:iron(III) transport system ATP-binding protein
MPGLEVRGVSHHYGTLRAVDDVALTVEAGQVVCLLGPSGCGKTTLLRLAAGLETLQTGQILIADQLVADASSALPPEQRGVGLVFQDYAVFPHLNVIDNVRFGLHRLPGAEQRARALEVLASVGLSDLAAAYPHTLSGGQQQRVALARALAPRPAVMLLDEPFAGLDRRLREQVREDTLRVLKASGAAVLLVTHDPEEAMAMGDRIAIMQAGRIEQVGTPAEVYLRPVTAFVARFLGETNQFQGVVERGAVATPLGPIPTAEQPDGQPVDILVRPELLQVLPAPPTPASSLASVREVRLIGATTVLDLTLPGPNGEHQVRALTIGPSPLQPGTTVTIHLDPHQAFVFPRNGHP